MKRRKADAAEDSSPENSRKDAVKRSRRHSNHEKSLTQVASHKKKGRMTGGSTAINRSCTDDSDEGEE